jgi:diguanylate cyclase (GGDEF)-like protein
VHRPRLAHVANYWGRARSTGRMIRMATARKHVRVDTGPTLSSGVLPARAAGLASRLRDRAAHLTPTVYAMAGLLIVYGLWQLLRWPAADRTLVGDMFFYPVGLAAAGTAFRASRRCSETPRLRSAWRLLAIGSLCYLAGDIAQTIYELGGAKPYPSVADAFYVLFYPLILAGLLRFPAPRRARGERVRLGLDLAVVAIGGFALVFYVVLGPTVLADGGSALQSAFSVAYPVGDMILLAGLASVVLRGTAASSLTALRTLGIGMCFFVAADLVYGYITLHSTYQGGDPVDALWMVAIAIFAIAGSAQRAPDPTAEEAVALRPVRASWMPYVAVAVGYGLLTLAERHDALVPAGVLLVAAAALMGLVSVRQLLAQRDLVSTRGQLSHQSLHDTLTGLPNRALVLDRAERMLARARRNHTPVAALYVDIDGFKQVNDSFGHASGDTLLQAVAARISGTIRECDTAGRLGGDEFVVLLEDLPEEIGAELVAERLCEVLAQSVEFEGAHGRALSVSASIGVAVGTRACADDLLRDADFAMYEAKTAGRNRWVTFDTSMHTAAQERRGLELDLGRALEEDRFFLLYQPTFDLRTERIVGVEALIRWRDPVRGVVVPDTFIPLAESSGLIASIGRWVLRTACAQAVAWRRINPTLEMSVNLSARQLDDESLISDLTATLAETGLDPAALTLEITETALMRDPAAATRRLQAVKALGVRIAIDDFGTGYSSLAYLRQFPVDALKIDRSFISGLATSRESEALIHMLVQLGKSMGLRTLGEGIEEPVQLRRLQRERCDVGQGFLFARPLEASAVAEMLVAAAEEQRESA